MTGYAGSRDYVGNLWSIVADSDPLVASSVHRTPAQGSVGISVGFSTETTGSLRNLFLDLVLFCLCFLMSLASFHKHDIANWIYVTIYARNHIEANALPDVRNTF